MFHANARMHTDVHAHILTITHTHTHTYLYMHIYTHDIETETNTFTIARHIFVGCGVGLGGGVFLRVRAGELLMAQSRLALGKMGCEKAPPRRPVHEGGGFADASGGGTFLSRANLHMGSGAVYGVTGQPPPHPIPHEQGRGACFTKCVHF